MIPFWFQETFAEDIVLNHNEEILGKVSLNDSYKITGPLDLWPPLDKFFDPAREGGGEWQRPNTRGCVVTRNRLEPGKCCASMMVAQIGKREFDTWSLFINRFSDKN